MRQIYLITILILSTIIVSGSIGSMVAYGIIGGSGTSKQSRRAAAGRQCQPEAGHRRLLQGAADRPAGSKSRDRSHGRRQGSCRGELRLYGHA